MKKILLFSLLFIIGNDISASMEINNPGEFSFGAICIAIGLGGICLMRKFIEEAYSYAQSKSDLKKALENYGAKVYESSGFDFEWNGYVTTKQWRLELPEYPSQHELHEICTTWNQFQKLIPMEHDFEIKFKGAFGLICFLLLGSVFICDSIK